MDIEIWDGGLQEHELEAIKKIRLAFTEGQTGNKSQNKGGSLRDQLQSKLGRNGMFPWKGYAGFRFVDSKGKEGEFDLVIVTHCNVLVIELKDWNFEPVTMDGDTWFKGEKNMGRSPVSITRSKKYTLENKLKKLTHRFTNKGYAPHVYFFVVMTGNADFSQLPEVELQHTISLEDFLKYSNQGRFNGHFRPHPHSQVLNKDFSIFNELFLGGNTAPKSLRIGGYTAVEEIFEHPKLVYKEYLASSEISKGTEALLRVWNFKNIQGNKGITPEGRAQIVSREREVLQFINHQSRDLYNHCLRSLTSFEKDEVTSQYSEVYELPPGHVRFNEFIGKYGQLLTPGDRLNLVKLLVAKFGDLHDLKIAHRDIADHSLWLSPSKEIALSNFITAYHQPAGTVGDYRSNLSVGAAEVKEMLGSSVLNPFEQDVHALGVVSWHLLTAKRMSPKSLEGLEADILSSSEWYAGLLLDAVGGKFKDGASFFDGLKQAEPQVESLPTFDDNELHPYRRPINHSRQYREDGDFIRETGDREVYLSGGRLVKAWLNVGSEGGDLVSNFHVLSFLKKLDKLVDVNPTCLPKIYEYGLATKSGSMFLVMEQVDGETWNEAHLEQSEKQEIIEKLVGAVEHIHELGISHGDLHPENVMIGRQDRNVYLIDIPDFSRNLEEVKNHRYSPENIDSCSAFERDIFAVLKMSSEQINLEWGGESQEFPSLAEAIRTELDDTEFGFRDLGRFKKALKQTTAAQEKKCVEIELSNLDEALTILPDNGRLFVKLKASRKDASEVSVTFSGIGGTFTAFYNKDQRCFVSGKFPRARTNVNPRDEQESQFEIGTSLSIKPGKPSQLIELSEYLRDDEAFNRAIDVLEQVETAPDHQSELSLQLKEAFEVVDHSGVEGGAGVALEISTRALWRAILETESQSSPNIELNGSVISPTDAGTALILPYEADIDPLGAFSNADEVEALLIDPDGTERNIGEVSLKRSALNEVRLTRARMAAYRLKDGDTVFFRTKQDRASFRKRKVALERLLDREGVLPELLDLFDPACNRVATNYSIEVTDEDFARYDREDQHGHKISLNQQQREAFSKLLNFGPLSLLQGPPGTGKTEFIAAFVHFLVEKLKTKRILLVSQSHEAVNTAAERIRKHCARLGTSLEVVRFSNREGAVSHGLKDVYSHAITAEKRELFNAEYRYRAAELSGALGLEAEFVSKLVDAELKLFKQIDHFESLLASFEDIDNGEDARALKAIASDLDGTLRSKLADSYGIDLPREARISEAKNILLSKLCAEYGVRPNESKRVRALARISRDMQDALSADRVNLDEFYARSRQLVTGTCVGIGQGHIGIHENIYDFVIIDEAARSISSELAIAMQSAKRVLLVGDHLQLPPLYSDAHKSALARRLGINDERTELNAVLKSDFARAFTSEYGEQASATLLTQYRMVPPIGDLVSNTFYKGKLSNGPRSILRIYDDAPNALTSPVTWLDTSSLGERANHQNDRGVSIYNRCEAEQVMQVLKQIASSGQFLVNLTHLKEKDDALIGVICMYAEQKRLLRQKFNQEVWAEGFKDLVKIDTVDSYQGKENRIIILSLTRSDRTRYPGFLRAPNRINVAMSRAMDRLLIVGNTDMWKKHNSDKPLGQVVSYMTDMGEKAGYRFVTAQDNR
ncbi:AAA domain-containing protein [Alcaligenes nematophilus]|uniref:AAA domain-containing protein n=1 Tax=Alcaligenes nematophilus TaxID=2994643 RepID=UPI00246042DC|nr:AAA domain-containing protein [Alcaligenes nematophilus]MDH4865457.1 AAA domain-containing protein [Bacillus cereus]MDY7126754.1 AAA domain-containing protein [Alcaligenes nematophilus]